MNEESITFFLDLIFNPNIKDGLFENVEKQKNKLRQQIISIKDNKIKFSMLKMMETVKDRPYSYNTFGYIEEIDEITGKNLYEYYQKVLNEDQIDIFVLGDFDSYEMKEIFKNKFKINTFKKSNKNILVKELPIRKRIVKYKEEDNVNQVQLLMLCSLNNLTDYERKYVIKLYGEILGGSSNSILFNTVREKKGYCYYINSMVKSYDNILIINSGIEKENVDKCLKLIRKCMKEMREGKFTDEVITSSKNTITSSIRASFDNPIGVINSYFSKILVGF